MCIGTHSHSSRTGKIRHKGLQKAEADTLYDRSWTVSRSSGDEPHTAGDFTER